MIRALVLVLLLVGCSIDTDEPLTPPPHGAADRCPARWWCDREGFCRCSEVARPAGDGGRGEP